MVTDGAPDPDADLRRPMRKLTCGAVGMALGAGLLATAAVPATAAPDTGLGTTAATATPSAAPLDDRPHPLEEKRRALRETAITGVLEGELTPQRIGGSTVVKVGDEAAPAAAATTTQRRGERAAAAQGQYVELARESTDKIFVILAEFGDERHPDYPDADTDPDTAGPTRFDGPRHNEIPEPDRSVDNSTIWQADFDKAHYEDIYFADDEGDESLKTYYETQSSGRYSVDGTVSDWVRVKYNAARYGREDASTWNLIQDAVNQWVADQEAAGVSDADIAAQLAEYDQQDRYDYDGDGDFNEPDGYIDHFQIVHAGGGEEDGDPTYGEDAIWSHRWYAFGTDQGKTGPEENKLGGAQIGDTGVWVGDYTIQPENGGYSVFAHEYGHDLGLPDNYDTAGGNNNVEYWSLMGQSRLSGADEPIGSRAGDLGAWEKLQLGWLDYETVTAGEKRSMTLGPQEYNTEDAQGVVVVLPDKEVTTELGEPAAGDRQWWSGSGDDLANTLGATADLTGATSATLSMQSRWSIEEEYDYLYVQASTDGGRNWTSLAGTADGEAFGTDASGSPAIDGEQEEWVDVEVPLDAYVGAPVELRLLYRTDGGLALPGFFADDITLTVDGEVVLADGAEDPDASVLELDGFTSVGATSTEEYDNFYVAGHRSYVSYDQYLRTGPYNFGWASTRPDWVEHFPYQTGLLVTYWDTSQVDNNVSQHPGEGRNLIVDAHARPMANIEGDYWRTRIQSYDAPFSTRKADSFTLHVDGKPSYVRGQAAARTFDDTKKYFYDEFPAGGTKLPATGTKIRVASEDGTSMKIRVTGPTVTD